MTTIVSKLSLRSNWGNIYNLPLRLDSFTSTIKLIRVYLDKSVYFLKRVYCSMYERASYCWEYGRIWICWNYCLLQSVILSKVLLLFPSVSITQYSTAAKSGK